MGRNNGDRKTFAGLNQASGKVTVSTLERAIRQMNGIDKDRALRLQQLSQMVEEGTYEIDVSAIARKIMLDRNCLLYLLGKKD